MLVFAFASPAYRIRRAGALRADEDGLRLADATVAARRDMVSAYLVDADALVVRIVRRRAPSLEVHLGTEADARSVVEALGFAVGQSVVTFSAMYGGGNRSILANVAAFALAGAGGVTVGALQHRGGLVFVIRATLFGCAILGMVYARTYTRVVVGSDGVLLRRLGDNRFISYGELSDVSAEGRSIALVLRSGDIVRLSPNPPASRDALLTRIEEARAAFMPEDRSGAALIDPGGRSVEQWLQDLRAMSTGRAYREARPDRESLWRLLVSPSSPPAVRAGAALALSASLDDASRARLRVTAEACAEPRLRVALTRVAEGAPDPDLEEALAPLIEERA